MIWSIIVGNEWRRSFLTRYLSLQYQGFIWAPVRQPSKPLHFELSRFAAVLHQKVKTYMRDNPGFADAERIVKINESSGSRFLSRLGWIARSRPLILPSGRILLPLYSDTLSLSVMALSDDGGATWSSSEPIVGLGSIQPTVVPKNDSTLVAYMRNAGPPPKRLYMSVSKYNGMTWSFAKETTLPNPDSAAEVIRLENGLWAMAYNDTKAGRHRLAISISDDEGKSWRWTRHLEQDTRSSGAGQFHYPSIVQDKNKVLHVSYSYFLNHLSREAPNKAIKHAAFTVDWVQRGAQITRRN